jgi:hypothetical protein
MKFAHFIFVGLLAACGSGGGLTYKLAPSPGLYPPPQAKNADCDFRIGKDGPKDGTYDKLGELTPADFAATSQDDLKGAIHSQVCQLGGDYVIATQNEAGNFSSAVVLRHHMDAPPGGASGAPAPAPAPAGSAAP